MKQRKFIHRLVDMVEHELEATLAILIVLAAIVGYTLAGTETATNLLTAQGTAGLSIGSSTYSTLSFDRTYTDGLTYQVRKLSIDPSNAASVSGKGLTGSSAGQYTATIALSQSFTGKLYVHGVFDSISLNGTAVASPVSPVTVLDAESLIVSFHGISDHIRAISVLPGTATDNQSTEVANLSLLPSLATTVTGTPRTFLVIATNTSGASIPSNQLDLVWSIKTTPDKIATINENGVVTPTAAGTIVVTAKVKEKTASATITVIDKPAVETKPIAVAPSTPTDTTKNTTVPKDQTTGNSWSSEWNGAPNSTSNGQSLLNQVADLLVKPADAATNETATPAKAITEVLFSDAAIVNRQSTAPTQAELNTVTSNLNLVQKVAARFSVAAKQMVSDIHSMIFGTEIKDTQGNTVIKQPNAIGMLASKLHNIISGAGAAPMKIDESGDLPN